MVRRIGIRAVRIRAAMAIGVRSSIRPMQTRKTTKEIGALRAVRFLCQLPSLVAAPYARAQTHMTTWSAAIRRRRTILSTGGTLAGSVPGSRTLPALPFPFSMGVFAPATPMPKSSCEVETVEAVRRCSLGESAAGAASTLMLSRGTYSGSEDGGGRFRSASVEGRSGYWRSR